MASQGSDASMGEVTDSQLDREAAALLAADPNNDLPLVPRLVCSQLSTSCSALLPLG